LAWENVEFTLALFKDYKDVWILTALDDIQTLLEESNVQITNITSNRFVGPIWERVEPVMKMFGTF
jgi:hypothetical protein